MFQNQVAPNVLPFDMSKGRNPHGGKTFYVDCFESAGPPAKRKGNDDWEGTDPEFPLETLEAAYAKVTDRHNDYIFVQNFWTLSPAETLVIAKTKLHLIGIGSGNFDNSNDIDGGSVASLELATRADDLELAGFNLGNDGSAEAIDVTGQVSRVHIHHCNFGWNYPVTDGIAFTVGGALLYPTIEHCYFGPNFSSRGINAYLNTGLIAYNIFRKPGVEAILIGGFGVGIFGNQFYVRYDHGLAAGWAVHLDANAYECFVNHNWAAEVGDVSAANPYRDLSSGAVGTCLNGWCDNFDGPALSAGPDVA
jgi:hypothetical protein